MKPPIVRVPGAVRRMSLTDAVAAAGLALLVPLLSLVPPPGELHQLLPGLGGPAPRGVILRAPSVERLATAFAKRGYRLETVARDGAVPKLFLERLPPGLGRVADAERRKALFLLGVLPMVLHVNEVIRGQRERLLSLERRMRDGGTPTAPERAWLERLGRRYGVENGDIETLRARVDVIPPALALAQAAIESDWGRSRFAREGNALFGQWTFDRDRGMTPSEADAESRHGVTRFARLVDSVAAYAMNLNTHAAYFAFRRERAAMRRSGETPDGYTLAAYLHAYSERREAYVQTLRGVIRDNALWRLRSARLRPPP
jgi:Bax protein